MFNIKQKTMISNPDVSIEKDYQIEDLERLTRRKESLVREINVLEQKKEKVQQDIKAYESRKRKNLLRKLQYERSIIQELRDEKKRVADDLYKMKGRLHKLRGFLYLRDTLKG